MTASDAAAGDEFGLAVAISGAVAVIGAPFKNSHAGRAYVFARSGATWSQQAELTASDAARHDFLGSAVAVSGDIAFVGAYGKHANEGAAYVFARSVTGWHQQAKLTEPRARAGDYFGLSVAVSGTAALVGAPFTNSAVRAAYVYVWTGRAWSRQARLTDPRPAVSDTFGSSVALYGTTAVIGAPQEHVNTGAAYVFTRTGARWLSTVRLTDPHPAINTFFGHFVAVWGTIALINASASNSPGGTTFVFARSGGRWSRKASLPGAAPVAVSGATVLQGEPLQNSSAGAAAVYSLG